MKLLTIITLVLEAYQPKKISNNSLLYKRIRKNTYFLKSPNFTVGELRKGICKPVGLLGFLIAQWRQRKHKIFIKSWHKYVLIRNVNRLNPHQEYQLEKQTGCQGVHRRKSPGNVIGKSVKSAKVNFLWLGWGKSTRLDVTQIIIERKRQTEVKK